MLESALTFTATELYKQLVAAFEVKTVYKVSFSKEISPDVLEIIKYLKGDLSPQDIIPDFPTSLTLQVKTPGNIIKIFHQDNNTYMQVFDEDNFKKFAAECLDLIHTSPT